MVDAVATVAGGLMADAAASFGLGLKEDEVLSVDEGADMLVDAEVLPRQRRTKIKIQIRNSKQCSYRNKIQTVRYLPSVLMPV